MTDRRTFAALLPDGWAKMPFEPFREGVEICHLWRGGPDMALLRYAKGASIPLHRHTGLETILVLEGSQSDDSGCYEAGTLTFNPAGTEHHIWSETGCTVLIQWEKPVEFIQPPP